MKRQAFPILLCILLIIGLTAACDSTTAAHLLAVVEAEAENQAQSEPSVAAASAQQPELPTGLRKLGELYGMEFVYVPAGEFTMGSSEAQVDAALEMCNARMDGCDRAWFESEAPQQQVYLDGYWLGVTEITHEQYSAFVEAGGYEDSSLWTESGWQWRESTGATRPYCWGDSNSIQPDQPVVCVSWYEAVAYTRWLSRETSLDVHLPTEAEWEKACRGTDGRTFPWGEEPPDGSRANYCDIHCGGDGMDENADDGYEIVAPVGSYPAGTSPYGAVDMAGNVFEWTANKPARYPYDAGDGRESLEGGGSRMYRGGSWHGDERDLRCANRYLGAPLGSMEVGFRVVAP